MGFDGSDVCCVLRSLIKISKLVGRGRYQREPKTGLAIESCRHPTRCSSGRRPVRQADSKMGWLLVRLLRFMQCFCDSADPPEAGAFYGSPKSGWLLKVAVTRPAVPMAVGHLA